MSKQQLLRRLLRVAEGMVQGGLSETTRRCGNSGCICYRDPAQRHGPHLYLTYRSEGKNRALYVPAEHADEIRQAQAAWKEFGEIVSAIVAVNRERLQRAWTAKKRKTAQRRES
ncbi:MAG: DUF6788 family protein [Gammaproteobacteria bacterium]